MVDWLINWSRRQVAKCCSMCSLIMFNSIQFNSVNLTARIPLGSTRSSNIWLVFNTKSSSFSLLKSSTLYFNSFDSILSKHLIGSILFVSFKLESPIFSSSIWCSRPTLNGANLSKSTNLNETLRLLVINYWSGLIIVIIISYYVRLVCLFVCLFVWVQIRIQVQVQVQVQSIQVFFQIQRRTNKV